MFFSRPPIAAAVKIGRKDSPVLVDLLVEYKTIFQVPKPPCEHQ